MSVQPRIYLASRSPRRRELLHQIHVSFEVLLLRAGMRQDPEVTEDTLAGEKAIDYVQRIARTKAQHGLTLMQQRRLVPHPVLAADTTIDLDGEIIGKPDSPEHAEEILARLGGRTHRVLTAVAVASGEAREHLLNINEVRFRRIEADEIRRYVASGEPLDKAGAYAVQGRAAIFIEEIRGSYSGIMGLPLYETAALLRKFGYPI